MKNDNRGFIWGDLIDFYHLLRIKNPCNSCIVKACCKTKCKDIMTFESFCYPYDSLKGKTISNILSLCAYIMILSGIIYSVVKISQLGS